MRLGNVAFVFHIRELLSETSGLGLETVHPTTFFAFSPLCCHTHPGEHKEVMQNRIAGKIQEEEYSDYPQIKF